MEKIRRIHLTERQFSVAQFLAARDAKRKGAITSSDPAKF